MKNKSLFIVFKYAFYTIKAYLALLIIMLIILILTPIALLMIYTFDKERKFYLVSTRILIRLFFILNFLSLKKRINFNNIKAPNKNTSRIYILNHQSLLDGLIFFLLPGNIKFMSNALYTKIPIFGLGVSLTGNISIARNNDGGFLDQYYQASDILDKKYPLAICPEGTREKTGKIGKFYQSAFKLAFEKKAEIVPVVLDTWNVLRPKSFIIRDNDFKVNFLNLLKYDDYKQLDYKKMSDIIRYQMIKELIKMIKEKRKNPLKMLIHQERLKLLESELDTLIIKIQGKHIK